MGNTIFEFLLNWGILFLIFILPIIYIIFIIPIRIGKMRRELLDKNRILEEELWEIKRLLKADKSAKNKNLFDELNEK
ncbi:MAG: hypothetical protein KDD63_28845 [Bacteroidetes bacterium]|nr:hypothetical protein [Bacteroidota bacterium]MCB0856274.1 hypothetical protein [Bacteroidota bacterium]